MAAPVSNVWLSGAGAANPAPLYQRWFQEFKGAQFTYQAGAVGGTRELRLGRVDFLASDMPLTDPPNRDTRSAPLQFPTAVAAVVAVYNVPGIYEELKLTPEILAGIYLGEIHSWNDPRIAEANPRASLPATSIIVINRTDPSATTYTWTDYLSKISASWKARVGAARLVTLPVPGPVATGDEGVAGVVHQTLYSLGFVDFAFAMKHTPCPSPAASGIVPELSSSPAPPALAQRPQQRPIFGPR